MKIYRYGIIGPGKIANSFCKALQRNDRSQIYAVASRDGDRAKSFANDFGAPVHYDSYEAIAKDPNVDVIYIATPHSFHEEQAILCLKHHKPVVCEKPLTLSVASTKRIIDAAAKNKTFLLEGMWSRFNPCVKRAKEIIDNGAIGEVRFLSADFGFSKPYDPSTRLYDLKLGGGSILDVGVYPLFLALYILGRPDKILTSAHLAPTGADESCAFTLSYSFGATAQLFSSMVLETKKEAVIIGTSGTITIHTPWYKSMSLTVSKPGRRDELIELPYPGNGFEFQIEEVNRCLDEGWLESPLLPHSFSVMKAEVSDEILRQAGVHYAG